MEDQHEMRICLIMTRVVEHYVLCLIMVKDCLNVILPCSPKGCAGKADCESHWEHLNCISADHAHCYDAKCICSRW